MRYVAFHTGGYYEAVYLRYLKPSSEKFGVPVDCHVLASHGDWTKNTRLKAQFLLEMLQSCDEDLVYLDVDSEFLQKPTLFAEIHESCDLAVHHLDWYRHWRGETGRPERELYNPVMFLRNNVRIHRLMHRWIDKNADTVYFEQKVLDEVLQASPDVAVLDLPIEYACPVDRSGNIPSYVERPVILQHQASRAVKADKSLLTR